jgi:hypothetical protein
MTLTPYQKKKKITLLLNFIHKYFAFELINLIFSDHINHTNSLSIQPNFGVEELFKTNCYCNYCI